MPLEGRIAKFLDKYTVVINIGAEDGVEQSDKFVVYEVSDPVIDPETEEDLGSIEYTKAKIRPENIMENMTVMKTSESTTTTPISNVAALTGETKPKKLSNSSDIESHKDEVQRGDRVRRINEQE
jgi:hypothetical protein